MRIPKIFTPRFSLGVPGVPGVSDSADVMKNKVFDSISADTPLEELGVPGVTDIALSTANRHSGTPDTPDDSAGVAEKLLFKRLNLKEALNPGTPGTPDTPENPSRRNLLPDTGPLPEGLTEIEARLYRAIAAHPGLTRAQLCEQADLTLDEFNARTPTLCGRLLAWPDFARYGGWVTASQAQGGQP